MGLTTFIENVFRRYLPSPFTIAILLTVLTLVLALFLTEPSQNENQLTAILSYWESGIWNNGLLVFAYQMMLILVLGHVLVLSKPVERVIMHLTKHVHNTSNAAVLVALPTMLVSFFNWGLGLIFGAILARKVGEYAEANNIDLNYPLIGASGYAGLMVWHGGISGSAPIKVAESGHLKELMQGVSTNGVAQSMPDAISTGLTVFSVSNLLIFAVVAMAISLLVYFLGKKTSPTKIHLGTYEFKHEKKHTLLGAEKLDHSKILSSFFGILVLAVFLLQYLPALQSLNITPNMLNFFMFGLALVLHGSIKSFLSAIEEAIGDVAGILIQFPLYFGIMGIMSQSGMINQISDFFVSISTETTLPIFTFLSAGLVNIFVPSGGGQWAVQGPLVLESAMQLGVPLPKAIMALAYGDQLTNMLQPFWALPLLGITKLKAKEILPYTLLFMLVGGAIYIGGLLLF
ncbi:MAG: short-chain fatty acid transporter [Muricauda sp.]|nr:TIGR00366 family protein [Allomuricauda sp.]MAU26489.1 short-chain fatty acid transporter [Allomuricauda sp.]MBC30065.1 short-chain fatty acid transporter [Allomuricauda sp.]|tara:strand:+ start:9106 stop:10482 length:1377 start_codon:yes stop_codon:yes gene_type:complete